MKNIFFILLISLLLFSCNNEKTRIITSFEKTGQLVAEIHKLSTPIYLPRYLGVTDDFLFIYKDKEPELFEIFSLSYYTHVYSGGNRGQGPEDFTTSLDVRSFRIFNNGFDVIEAGTNLLKTVLINEEGLQIVNREKMLIDNASINGFYYLSNNVYLTFGNPMETNEYSLYNKQTGSTIKVGEYPNWAPIDKSVPLIFPYLKTCVVHPDGKKFGAFYARFKRLRIHDDSGNLLNDIEVRIAPYKNDFDKFDQLYSYYQGQPYAIGKYIYVMCGNYREGQGGDQKEQAINYELQIWDWQGNAVGCYKFDRKIFLMAISEKTKKIYALDNLIDNELYVYDLPNL